MVLRTAILRARLEQKKINSNLRSKEIKRLRRAFYLAPGIIKDYLVLDYKFSLKEWVKSHEYKLLRDDIAFIDQNYDSSLSYDLQPKNTVTY